MGLVQKPHGKVGIGVAQRRASGIGAPWPIVASPIRVGCALFVEQ
jgi:hypothetical protein